METVLLGPVRTADVLASEVRRVLRGDPDILQMEPLYPEEDSRLGVITAGWREWEDQDRGLWAGLPRPHINLALFARAERVRRADPEFAAAQRAYRDRRRLLRRSYNLRLAQAATAWITLDEMEGDEGVLGPERESACEAVRALDRHHLARIQELREEFDARWRPGERESVARERAEIATAFADVHLVVIAGGHVPVLLDCLRLFDLAGALAKRAVIAWGGGAMALTERVVFFHDSPPWGPGHAEVGEVGLGRVPHMCLFPDGRRRLRLDDPARIARLGRRLAPDIAVILDPGGRLDWRRSDMDVAGAFALLGTPPKVHQMSDGLWGLDPFQSLWIIRDSGGPGPYRPGGGP